MSGLEVVRGGGGGSYYCYLQTTGPFPFSFRVVRFYTDVGKGSKECIVGYSKSKKDGLLGYTKNSKDGLVGYTKNKVALVGYKCGEQ